MFALDMAVQANAAAKDFAKKTKKELSKAQRSGMRKTGNVVKRTFKETAGFRGDIAPQGMLGTRSGTLRKNITTKTFRYQDDTWGASVRVKGRRAFVFRLHEDGYTVGKTNRTTVEARKPGQTALDRHQAEIPQLIEDFIKDALARV